MRRLDGDVERGRRLVRDDEPRPAGKGHRDEHALAHAARNLVRVLAQKIGAVAASARPSTGRARVARRPADN